MTSPALNQILFGPPGTGKTFATIEAALEILAPEFLQTNKENRAALKKRFDELAADGHVEFVTFHQSFSYEDFVEGLRAESGDDGQLRYNVVDGVFKKLCTTDILFKRGEKFGTGYIVTHSSADIVELSKPKGNQLPIGMSILNKLAGYVREKLITVEDIRTKQVLLKVPKTELDPHLLKGYNNILPLLVARILDAPSKRAEVNATTQPSNARVLIIDEINRGNISRIFGELITLIEPSKRAGADEALEVMLPYSKKHFSVPNNVYLIGTMNTADRSLAGLDIALRRRFTFREMLPKPELLKDIAVGELNIAKLLRVMNQRIEMLLDRDHCLGHAYFMPLDSDRTLERLGQIFREQVLPLLQEYFFEDWQRIQWVFNDHRKAPENCFIKQPPFKPDSLFGDQVVLNNQNNQWLINEEAFSRIESYWGVIDHQTVLPQLQDAIETEKGDIQIHQLEKGVTA
ncbi:5-methylcytosine-specific restriction enzyme B [compost metagenome]